MNRSSPSDNLSAGRDGRTEDILVPGATLKELRASEEKFRMLFTSIDQGVCLIHVMFDPEGKAADYRFLETNPAFVNQTGLQDAVGRTMRELAPNHEEFWFETYGRIAKTGESERFEHEASQLGRFYDVYAVRVGPADQHRVGIVFDNISVRKQAEEEQRKSEVRLRLFVNASSEIVYRMSADWGEVLSIEGKQFLNHSPKNRQAWLDEYIPGGEKIRVKEAVALAIRTKAPFEMEHQVNRADGTLGWVHSRAVPFLDVRGKITEWFGAVIDITERKRVEQAMRASDERQAFLLKLSDALRSCRDALGIQAVASRLLGEHLGVDRAYYVEVDEVSQEFVVERDWHLPGAISHARRYPLKDWSMPWLNNGKTWVVRDVDTEPTLPDVQKPAYRLQQIGAIVVVPLLKVGKLAGTFVVNQSARRDWKPEEVMLVGETVERTWASIDRARAEAAVREAGRRKGEFLAMLGHELRNPLAAIDGGVKLLQSSRVDAEAREATLPIVAQQIAHMRRLIDDVLDLARLEHGRLQVQLVDVDLEPTLLAARRMVQSVSQGMSSQILYQPPTRPVRLRADPERLVQVFANLFANGLKFSSLDSVVEVSVEEGRDSVTIQVRDTGRGISAEDLPQIFEPFVQSKLSLGMPDGGLGLGLSISREIVGLHGGTITAASLGVGLGSTFTVVLPLGSKS